MMELDPPLEDDEDLALRMLCEDADALREVLRRHLEPVRDLLIGKYGTTVQRADIDEAMNKAILKMWQTAGSYNKERGDLGAWLFTMAQSAVLDIFRRERKHRKKYPLLDPEIDRAAECDPTPEPDEPLTKAEKQEMKDLDFVIEQKLKGHQKAIIKADLAAGGTADAASLAEMLGTSKNSIYVSRNKAHDNLRQEMIQLAQERERQRGKK